MAPACVPQAQVQGLLATGPLNLSHIPVTATEREICNAVGQALGNSESATFLMGHWIPRTHLWPRLGWNEGGRGEWLGRASVTGPTSLWGQSYNLARKNFYGILFNFLNS